MRRYRWLCILIFVLAGVYFILYMINEVQGRDAGGPVIEMDTEIIEISVNDGEEALLTGMTAADDKDGDVTSSIVIESVSSFVEDDVRYVNYAAFDSNNHVTKVSRKMVYTDYTDAHFYLEKPLRFPASTATNVDYLKGVSATDCLDGDVSDDVIFSQGSSIDADVAGDYRVELEVKNSAGAVTKLPVTVSIYEAAEENASPQIILTDYIVYTKAGQSLDPKEYIQSVLWRSTEYMPTDGRGTFAVDTTEMSAEERAAFQEEDPAVSYSRFTIVDRTRYSEPGVYEIQYFLEDANEKTGRVNLIVVVEEE